MEIFLKFETEHFCMLTNNNRDKIFKWGSPCLHPLLPPKVKFCIYGTILLKFEKEHPAPAAAVADHPKNQATSRRGVLYMMPQQL